MQYAADKEGEEKERGDGRNWKEGKGGGGGGGRREVGGVDRQMGGRGWMGMGWRGWGDGVEEYGVEGWRGWEGEEGWRGWEAEDERREGGRGGGEDGRGWERMMGGRRGLEG